MKKNILFFTFLTTVSFILSYEVKNNLEIQILPQDRNKIINVMSSLIERRDDQTLALLHTKARTNRSGFLTQKGYVTAFQATVIRDTLHKDNQGHFIIREY